MTKRIALIGSAPSSVALAPYHDPEWQIWACSPGARPYVKRVDAWFEIHLWEPDKPWFSKEYIEFMAGLPCPVFVLEPEKTGIPGAVHYPKEEMLAEFGPYFFTSTLSYMFALAIMSGATEIGMWGVDMSAQEEWQWQRQGCQHFIWEAKKRGIKVTIPGQSDLLRPPPLYGFCETNPMHQKLLARAAELDGRIAQVAATVAQAQREYDYLRGAREDVEYMLKTWVSDRQSIDMTGWVAPRLTPAIPPVSETELSDRPKPSRVDELISTLNDKRPPAPSGKTTWQSTPAPNMVNGLEA